MRRRINKLHAKELRHVYEHKRWLVSMNEATRAEERQRLRKEEEWRHMKFKQEQKIFDLDVKKGDMRLARLTRQLEELDSGEVEERIKIEQRTKRTELELLRWKEKSLSAELNRLKNQIQGMRRKRRRSSSSSGSSSREQDAGSHRHNNSSCSSSDGPQRGAKYRKFMDDDDNVVRRFPAKKQRSKEERKRDHNHR